MFEIAILPIVATIVLFFKRSESKKYRLAFIIVSSITLIILTGVTVAATAYFTSD